MTTLKVVLTGGFGTLGRAVAHAFVTRGARIALIDRTAPDSTLAREFAAPNLTLGGIDLTDWNSTKAAIDSVQRGFGGLDVLVNIAGGFRWQTLEEGDIAGWDSMYHMNLKTAVMASKAALPFIVASQMGRIINIGAGAAAKPAAAGMGAYTASKAGVIKLTESLAEELKDRGVSVNAVLPGTIDTSQNRADMPDADFSRWVKAAEIAEVIAFLASDAGAPITGAAIPVFGRG